MQIMKLTKLNSKMQSKPLVYDQSGVHEMLPQNFIHIKYIYISIHIKGNKKHVNSPHFLMFTTDYDSQ